MKKLLVLTTVAALHISPLTALAQRRNPPQRGSQTKTGRITVDITYDAVETWQVSKRDESGATQDESYTTRFHIQAQESQVSRFMRHDGFVSVVEPSQPSASGSFSYEHTGEAHNTDSQRQRYDMNENASFKGNIAAGNLNVAMAESGDAISVISASVKANGNGAFKKVEKDRNGTRTDNNCQTGQATYANTAGNVQAPNQQPDGSKPPESACAVTMDKAFNVRAADLSADELPLEQTNAVRENWPKAVVSGSFDSGKYSFTINTSHQIIS